MNEECPGLTLPWPAEQQTPLLWLDVSRLAFEIYEPGPRSEELGGAGSRPEQLAGGPQAAGGRVVRRQQRCLPPAEVPAQPASQPAKHGQRGALQRLNELRGCCRDVLRTVLASCVEGCISSWRALRSLGFGSTPSIRNKLPHYK